MLKLYGTKSDSDSPLDVPRRVVSVLFIVAFVLAIVFANAGLRGMHQLAEDDLVEGTLVLGTDADSIDVRVKKLLPPELHNKVNKTSLKSDPFVAALFSNAAITYAETDSFLTHVRAAKRLHGDVTNELIGDLHNVADSIFVLEWIPIPKFTAKPPSEVLGISKYDRPNFRGVSTIEGENLHYAIGMGLITSFREQLTDSYFRSRRMIQAFGDIIQFITFVLALWGVLIALVRWQWCKVQKRLIVEGRLLRDADASVDFWKSLRAPKDERTLYLLYKEENGTALIPVQLFAEAIDLKHQGEMREATSFVNDRIDLMESRVQKGEYLLLDYLSYAIPNLGFIGTILGIILSMASVVGILQSSGVLDMVEAFDKVGGALGLAFDTTFVSLVWVLVLSFLITRLQKREAEMFDALREKACHYVKEYWGAGKAQ